MNYAVKNIYNRTNKNIVTVDVPGSKSITARAMLISALSRGVCTLYGAQLSDDCQTFLNCLKSLGVDYVFNGSALSIEGCGDGLKCKKASINVGSAGTAARFLPAALAFCDGEYTLDCSSQMRSRPIEPLCRALEELGAKFTFLGEKYRYPFIIRGTLNPAPQVSVDITESSQFLSALLMASVLAKKPIKIIPCGNHGLDYIEMTLDMMWSFGVNVAFDGKAYTVDGSYGAVRYHIEPDVSAACYFYAANAILGTNIKVNGIMSRSMQGDSAFIDLIKNFDGGEVDMHSFSDQALTLAAIAPYFSKPTHICGVAHIRRQECDRIKAIVYNLTKMGVKCEERDDGVIIYPSTPQPAHICTFGDHRVAMSFALTGLRADGIIIDDAEVCSKTFKNYFEVLDGVIEKLLAPEVR